MAWFVVRVRGGIHARHDIRDTLDFLHLSRPNHATIVPETDSFRGMLTKVQGYVTWGEADPATIDRLLRARARTPEGRPLPRDAAESKSSDERPSWPALTEAVARSGLVGVSGVRPVLRLKAPRGGWRSTKRPFALGGALGYRGPRMKDLAERML